MTHVLSIAAEDGHCYLPQDELTTGAIALLKCESVILLIEEKLVRGGINPSITSVIVSLSNNKSILGG